MLKSKRRPLLAQVGRRMVQAGMLLMFLYPILVAVYQKASFNPAPIFTSWLLPFDPTLLAGHLIHRELVGIIIGAPLLLLALSFIFGRFFCGWICPIGTLLDWVRPLAFWRSRKSLRNSSGLFPPARNRSLRYLILAFIFGASLLSLKFLGLLDPLVIFQRTSTTLASNVFSARQPGIRASIALISLVLTGIVALELWQPRLWCRSLCPLGALISLVSRFSLFKRVVNTSRCNQCQQCRRDCPMNAIPKSVASTDYSQCTFCLECVSSCSKEGIRFGFAPRLGPQPMAGVRAPSTVRQALKVLAAGIAGAAVVPLVELAPQKAVLRPPGALGEKEFLRTCILCQECVRACPSGALHPALLQNGLPGIGTPILIPRQGACALNPSCPDLCASVCPVGAILPTTKEEMKIGLAVVHREACLAWDQGAKCLVCVEACLNEAAIPYNGRVTVDASRCTGCGRCEAGCPVPGSAIRVEPIQPKAV